MSRLYVNDEEGGNSGAVLNRLGNVLHQLIIAHMLALHVPKGGARVVDFSVGEGRNLYYYPKDTVQVVGVNPNPKVPMLEAQGFIQTIFSCHGNVFDFQG